MESRVNYTLVGFFVILLTSCMIVAGFWLTAGRHTQSYKYYIVYINESVSGLSEQAPVKFNGVTVGYVESISLDVSNLQRVRLLLAVQESTPITTTTHALLLSQGITGVAHIGLEAKTADAPPLLSTPNEPYPVIASSPSLFMQLDKAIREVTKNISALSEGFQDIFSVENRNALNRVLKNTREFSNMLAKNTLAIEESLQSAKKLLNNSAKASKDLPKTMQNLNATLGEIRNASVQFKTAVQSGQRTVSQLGPNANRMVKRFDDLATNLNAVAKDVRRDPSVLVRGRVPQHPGPGE